MEKVKVRDIMTRPLITEDENETVDKIAREMAELGIGSVAVSYTHLTLPTTERV